MELPVKQQLQLLTTTETLFRFDAEDSTWESDVSDQHRNTRASSYGFIKPLL